VSSYLRKNEDQRKVVDPFIVIHLLSLTVCLVWLLQRGQGLIFFFDEWDFILRRSYEINDLFEPHNGHLSLVPILVYNFLRSLFGVDSYIPYQILGLIVHGSVCSAVFVIGKRRSVTVATGAAILICLLGSGWQNIMWPFQIGMMGALSAGLWAIWEATNTNTSTRKLVTLCLISLSCAGGGIVAYVVVLGIVSYQRSWRAYRWLLGVGLLYAMWYLLFGVSQSTPGNLMKVPGYLYDSAVSAANGIGARHDFFAYFFLLFLLVLFFWNVLRKQSIVVGLASISMALMTWMLTGISRAHMGEPEASRYVYVGAVLLVTCTVSLVPKNNTKGVFVVVIAALVYSVPPNLNVLDAGIGGLRDVSLHLKASLAGLVMIEGDTNANEALDMNRAPQFDAQRYLQISETRGSVGFSISELQQQPETIRLRADDALFRFMEELFVEMKPTSCSSPTFVSDSKVSIEPGEKVIVVSSTSTEAIFRWFTQEIETSSTLLMNPGIQYQLKNDVESGAVSLEVVFSDQMVVICN
jgi:hypothetical protein